MRDEARSYTYLTQWQEEEGYYVVLCLEWAGLSADGPTPEVALDRMLRLVSVCLADCEDDVEPPSPATLDDVLEITWNLSDTY